MAMFRRRREALGEYETLRQTQSASHDALPSESMSRVLGAREARVRYLLERNSQHLFTFTLLHKT